MDTENSGAPFMQLRTAGGGRGAAGCKARGGGGGLGGIENRGPGLKKVLQKVGGGMGGKLGIALNV